MSYIDQTGIGKLGQGLQDQALGLQLQTPNAIYNGPPPTPTAQQQLKTRATQLRDFLAIDHIAQRTAAERELSRIERALACLEGGE